MSITADHVGRTYPPAEPYEVSTAKVTEFARALGMDTAEPVAPPTFAFVIASQAWEALFADDELDLALHRILHADQKFTWARPMRAGDVLTAQLRIDSVRQRGSADMIGTTVTLRDEAGDEVATCSATLLHAHEEESQ